MKEGKSFQENRKELKWRTVEFSKGQKYVCKTGTAKYLIRKNVGRWMNDRERYNLQYSACVASATEMYRNGINSEVKEEREAFPIEEKETEKQNCRA